MLLSHINCVVLLTRSKVLILFLPHLRFEQFKQKKGREVAERQREDQIGRLN